MESILEVKNVFKSFEGKEVHRGVSFALKEGETLGLLGPSGTGKSVLWFVHAAGEYFPGNVFYLPVPFPYPPSLFLLL